MGRGRPCVVPKKLFCETVLPYCKRIIIDSQKIATKSDPVYQEISDKFQKKLSYESVYSMIASDRYDIRKQMLLDLNILPSQPTENLNESSEGSENLEEISNSNPKTILELIPFESFKSMTEERKYPRDALNSKTYIKFIPGKAQPFFNQILLEKARITCGLNYGNTHITVDRASGSLNGKKIDLT